VAAVANNSICAVGIAFNSKIGGIRILDGNIVDALEAKGNVNLFSLSDSGHMAKYFFGSFEF